MEPASVGFITYGDAHPALQQHAQPTRSTRGLCERGRKYPPPFMVVRKRGISRSTPGGKGSTVRLGTKKQKNVPLLSTTARSPHRCVNCSEAGGGRERVIPGCPRPWQLEPPPPDS